MADTSKKTTNILTPFVNELTTLLNRFWKQTDSAAGKAAEVLHGVRKRIKEKENPLGNMEGYLRALAEELRATGKAVEDKAEEDQSQQEAELAVGGTTGGAAANTNVTAAQREALAKVGLPPILPLALPGPWTSEFADAFMHADQGLGPDQHHLFTRWLSRVADIRGGDRGYIYKARLLRFSPGGQPDSYAMADVIRQHASMSEDEWLEWKAVNVMNVRL